VESTCWRMKTTTSPRVLSERRDASDAGRASVGRPQERSFRSLGVLSARAGDAGEREDERVCPALLHPCRGPREGRK